MASESSSLRASGRGARGNPTATRIHIEVGRARNNRGDLVVVGLRASFCVAPEQQALQRQVPISGNLGRHDQERGVLSDDHGGEFAGSGCDGPVLQDHPTFVRYSMALPSSLASIGTSTVAIVQI